jgi:protein-S-isoprenylcysteine O-methyltransferase Ste14
MLITLLALTWGGRIVPRLLGHPLVSGATGTMASWQAKVFGLVFLAFSLPILFHVLTHPALLKRRAHIGPVAEPEPKQKIIVALLLLCILAIGAVLGLDYDHSWSHVPVFVVLLGDVLVASGLGLIFLVFRANPFAAATVNVETEQAVVSTGPYALVRHPMYSGALLLSLGTPVALGSWWGLLLFPPILVLIIWRLLDEEQYLSARLPGYREYCAKVTHRLIPAVW